MFTHVGRIVLASASPRRRELLKKAGLSFSCLVPGVSEDVRDIVDPSKRSVAIASRKSHGALDLLGGDDSCPILACDTVVVFGDQIFGKPADAQDAHRMLGSLSGNTHHVVSGVSVLCGGREFSFSEVTAVTFKELTGEQIDRYIDSGEPFDKAGGYGIQGPAGAFVDRVEGDYENVVGLPLKRSLEVLDEAVAEMVAHAGDAGVSEDGGNALAKEKAQVRKQMKAVRKSIPADVRKKDSAEVCKEIMGSDEFSEAKVVAAYKAFGSELCFDYLAEHFPGNKKLVVPCSMPNHVMEFLEVSPESILPGASDLQFLKNPGKITEMPEGFDVVPESQISLMFVPGLAFDDEGYRMGYGGGYYDTYMSRKGFNAKVLGTYFEQQHYFGSLPHEEHDVPLSLLVTQEGFRRF
ncbi:MAG: 5-formyltetrahydrofolate cyclo-ligase [Coriobacteriales bacterium]